MPLFRLPYLARLDLSNNHFSDAAVRNLKKAAAKRNPKLRLIFDSAEAGASSNEMAAQPKPAAAAPKKKAGLMGSLLMKAHKEGNLEDAVDAMEAAGVE